MKELLELFFRELGLKYLADGVSQAHHRFLINIYCRIFKKEISNPDVIVSKERALEMKKLFYKELEKFE